MKHANFPGAALLLCVMPMSCALASKGDALSMRYFNPQPAAARPSQPAPQAFELRLGQVGSATNLDERVCYRINQAEVGYYDDRRWTELPEVYLRRALENELFQERQLTRIVAGEAPILDVELIAFEEQRGNPDKVRVKINFDLRDERRSLLERSVELEQPLGAQGDRAARVAQALTDTLDQAVTLLGAEVVARLER